jgi:dihydroflavonol-4-reductase
MPVTAINPGFILGPRFFKLSESVRQVADFVNRGMPFYFDGGFPVVDAEDVANGALLGMAKGRASERYIVGGDNLTVKQLYDLIAQFTGVRSPGFRAPVPVVRVIATLLEVAGKVTGTRPLMDRNMVDEFAGKWGYQQSTKAAQELGYTWRSASEVVRRTVAWLVDHGFVSERRQRALVLHHSLRGAY